MMMMLVLSGGIDSGSFFFFCYLLVFLLSCCCLRFLFSLVYVFGSTLSRCPCLSRSLSFSLSSSVCPLLFFSLVLFLRLCLFFSWPSPCLSPVFFFLCFFCSLPFVAFFFSCSAFYRARELQNQSCLCRTVIQITNEIVGRRRGPRFTADFLLNRLSLCETKGMMNSASKRRCLCPWEWLFFTLAPKRFKLNNWDLNH